jgi:hypothetical protein
MAAPVSINESSPNFICKSSKPEKVSAEQALEIQKQTKTAYVFNKVEIDSSGQISSYITTV